jgi:acyl carrier protein
MTTTLERLRAILITNYSFTPDLLTPAAALNDLGLDSLGMAELLFNIEDEFGVTMPTDAIQLVTLGDVVGMIDGLVVTQKKGEVQLLPNVDLPIPAA